MLPLEAYPALKFVHVSLVSCSGVLFAVRGASYGCAIGVYLFIASVAVTHSQLGFLRG